MKIIRILSLVLVFCLLMLPGLSVAAEGGLSAGQEVVSDQGDYFIYVVVVVSVLVMAGLGIFVFLRRRK
ncbi:MAG: hypothetical protein IKT43_04360 [Clostridia bacterium]|nr:hypothetical protein [Clostridia bacterium]